MPIPAFYCAQCNEVVAEPAVRLRGLDSHVTVADGPGAAALRRPPAEDLFR